MLLEFLLVIALIELTPGPNMVYLAALSAQAGWRAGLSAALGVTAGLSVYLLACVFGLSAAIAQLPALLQALRWAGIAYLVWLAWEAWRPERDNSPALAPNDAHAGYFMRGFITNVLNAKAAIFYTLLLPQFLAPNGAAIWMQSLWLGMAHLGVATFVHALLVFGAGRMHARVAQWKSSARVRLAFAIAILASAAWLAWQTRGIV